MGRGDFGSQKGSFHGQFASCQPPVVSVGSCLTETRASSGLAWRRGQCQALLSIVASRFRPRNAVEVPPVPPVGLPVRWHWAGTEEPVFAFQKLRVYRGNLRRADWESAPCELRWGTHVWAQGTPLP